MFQTMNGWTKEKMIEQIKNEMLDHVSANPNVSNRMVCAYRADDGNKCAIGVFIPNEVYNSSMEGRTPLSPEFWHVLAMYMPLNAHGMWQMQQIHDHSDVLFKNAMRPIDPRPLLIEWIQNNVE